MSWYAEFHDAVRLDEPLAKYTWFKLGGPAKYFCTPKDADQLRAMIARLRELDIPIFVLGGGANLLVRDEGVNGAVITLSADAFKTFEIDKNVVTVGAGRDVQKLVLDCTRAGLSGIECLAGIPGSVGGEVKMNAGGGVWGYWVACEDVTAMDTNGQIFVREKDDLVFEYRKSNISAKFILEATLDLSIDDPERVNKKVKEIWMYKKNSQPLQDYSAGCIFKNPRGLSAGALIDQAGMKGTKLGGAEVSTKHANFICASEGARAADVLSLIERMPKKGVGEV